MTIRRNRRPFVIPLNAMCDVAFLLLIFIMLVALINYRRVIAIDYAESDADARAVSAEKNCEIWVDAAGALYLDGVPVSLAAIEDEIGGRYREAPDTRIHIIADRNTAFSHIDKVLQILQLLQYRVVSFVVKHEVVKDEDAQNSD